MSHQPQPSSSPVRPPAATNTAARRGRRWQAALLYAGAAMVLPGCAVVSVAGAAAGAAISVTGAVVSTTVKVTGKVIEKGIDAVTPSSEP